MTRRDFLQQAQALAGLGGAALVAAGLPRRLWAAAQEPSDAQTSRRPQQRITLAVETSMFHRHQAAKAFGIIREAGFRFVELGEAHFRAGEATPQSVAELQRQLADAGLTPIGAFTVHPLASSDDKQRQAAVARWRHCIESAQRLGIKLLTMELTGQRDKPAEGESAFRKSLDELLSLLEQADLHLSVEPHPGDFFEDAMPSIKLLRSCRSKHLGYLHCTPHTFFFSAGSKQIIAEGGALLSHVHVADTFRTERIMARAGVGLHLHLRPGLGEVDLVEVFAALRAVGYGGYASLQLLSHADRPAEAARQAREHLQKLLGDQLAS